MVESESVPDFPEGVSRSVIFLERLGRDRRRWFESLDWRGSDDKCRATGAPCQPATEEGGHGVDAPTAQISRKQRRSYGDRETDEGGGHFEGALLPQLYQTKTPTNLSI